MKSKDLKTYLKLDLIQQNNMLFHLPTYYHGYYFFHQVNETTYYCISEYDYSLYICKIVNHMSIENKYLIYLNQILLEISDYPNSEHINDVKKFLKENYRSTIPELFDEINLLISSKN